MPVQAPRPHIVPAAPPHPRPETPDPAAAPSPVDQFVQCFADQLDAIDTLATAAATTLKRLAIPGADPEPAEPGRVPCQQIAAPHEPPEASTDVLLPLEDIKILALVLTALKLCRSRAKALADRVSEEWSATLPPDPADPVYVLTELAHDIPHAVTAYTTTLAAIALPHLRAARELGDPSPSIGPRTARDTISCSLRTVTVPLADVPPDPAYSEPDLAAIKRVLATGATIPGISTADHPAVTLRAPPKKPAPEGIWSNPTRRDLYASLRTVIDSPVPADTPVPDPVLTALQDAHATRSRPFARLAETLATTFEAIPVPAAAEPVAKAFQPSPDSDYVLAPAPDPTITADVPPAHIPLRLMQLRRMLDLAKQIGPLAQPPASPIDEELAALTKRLRTLTDEATRRITALVRPLADVPPANRTPVRLRSGLLSATLDVKTQPRVDNPDAVPPEHRKPRPADVPATGPAPSGFRRVIYPTVSVRLDSRTK